MIEKLRACHVVALIAIHNRIDYTRRCLTALKISAEGHNLTVIIVDDGSTDGSSEWLAAQGPDVTVLKGDGTLWFGGALQWALQEAKVRFPCCDYILTINNDTFLRPGALAAMIRASDGHASVGATFWIEDRQVLGSSGLTWAWLSGPRDFVLTEKFHIAQRSGERAFVEVDVLATTAALFPARFCFTVPGIDVQRHPHNRADICLTSQIRRAGSPFVVATYVIADHVYGPAGSRYSVRKLAFRDFLYYSFIDRIQPSNLPLSLLSLWMAAPTRLRALPVMGMRVLVFFRQLLGVTFLNLVRALR